MHDSENRIAYTKTLLQDHGVSVEEAQHLATSVLPSRILVVNDAGRRGQNNVAKLTGRQQVVHPLLNVCNLQVEARRDNADLVDAPVQVYDDLAAAVVVHDLKLAYVACRATQIVR